MFLNKSPPKDAWFLVSLHSPCPGNLYSPWFWRAPLPLPGVEDPVSVYHAYSYLVSLWLSSCERRVQCSFMLTRSHSSEHLRNNTEHQCHSQVPLGLISLPSPWQPSTEWMLAHTPPCPPPSAHAMLVIHTECPDVKTNVIRIHGSWKLTEETFSRGDKEAI